MLFITDMKIEIFTVSGSGPDLRGGAGGPGPRPPPTEGPPPNASYYF